MEMARLGVFHRDPIRSDKIRRINIPTVFNKHIRINKHTYYKEDMGNTHSSADGCWLLKVAEVFDSVPEGMWLLLNSLPLSRLREIVGFWQCRDHDC